MWFRLLVTILYILSPDTLSISVTPTNPVVGEGGTAQFIATASGPNNKKDFMYQWSKEGINSLPNKVSGVNGAMLTIPNLVESDEGVYYCNVTNGWGKNRKSNDIILTIQGTCTCMIISLHQYMCGDYYT